MLLIVVAVGGGKSPPLLPQWRCSNDVVACSFAGSGEDGIQGVGWVDVVGGEGDGEEVWNRTSPPSPLPLSSPGQIRQTQAELYAAVLAGALLQLDWYIITWYES